MGWLKEALEEDCVLNRTGSNPAYFNYIEWGNKVTDVQGSKKLWEKNIKTNINHWDKYQNNFIGQLKDFPSHENDCIIFVGASPILKQSVKYLKNLESRFKIVVANSALKYLIDHDIIPDYCILVDGNPGKWTFKWEQIRKKCKDVIGLFGVAAYPPEVQNWPGKFIIIPYQYEIPSTKKMIKKRYGDEAPLGGGNALNCSVSLFIQFTKASMMLFVANELSFKDAYYVNKGKAISDDKPYIFLTNIYGKEVRSLLPLYEYKIWLENIIESYHTQIYFCNCSGGVLGVEPDGSLLPGLEQKPLPEGLDHIRKAWAFEGQDIIIKNKQIYNELYETGDYVPTLSENYYLDMVKNGYELLHDKKILDFGCGLGRGVKVGRDAGYEIFGVDIADNKEIWERNDVEKYCISYDGIRTPYKDNEFDVVTCFETLEHIPPVNTESILREILRIGKHFAFTIALDIENAPLYGYIYTHINIRPANEWLKIFRNIGFNIIMASREKYGVDTKNNPVETVYIYASKGEPEIVLKMNCSAGNKSNKLFDMKRYGIL